MSLAAGPHGPIECLVTGAAEPITVFAHGFAGSIAETRPFGSGVLGSRVFFHFRGHGASADNEGLWTYGGLSAELIAVSDAYRASRAVGVSLGAGTVLANAARDPQRFERLVLVLPAAIDEPREARALERVESMARCADSGDVDGLTVLLLVAQPPALRTSRLVQVWAHQQAERLCGDRLRGAIRQIPLLHPLEDLSQLAVIECPVLLIGQHGDDAHPVRVVRELSEALPHARAELFPPGGVPWTHRAALRELISTFLNTGHAPERRDTGETR